MFDTAYNPDKVEAITVMLSSVADPVAIRKVIAALSEASTTGADLVMASALVLASFVSSVPDHREEHLQAIFRIIEKTAANPEILGLFRTSHEEV